MSETDAAAAPVQAEQPEVIPATEPVEQPVEDKTTEEKPAEAAEEKADAPEAKEDSKIIKTTAKIDYDNLNNNRKFDPSTRAVTDDPNAIRKQVLAFHLSRRPSTDKVRSSFTLEIGTSPRISSCGNPAADPTTSPS